MTDLDHELTMNVNRIDQGQGLTMIVNRIDLDLAQIMNVAMKGQVLVMNMTGTETITEVTGGIHTNTEEVCRL